MPELIGPTVAMHQEWLRAHREWSGEHQDGSGLADGEEVESAEGFAAFVTRLQNEADEANALPAGRVHCSYWWITEGRVVVGAVALRHELNDFLRDAGGHVGYSVRPSARRRGVAGWALARALQRASVMGIDPVLVTCAVDNEASRRTIEAAGGVLEDVRDTVLGRVERFWITSAAPGK
jgi:predicted acetyltransferase